MVCGVLKQLSPIHVSCSLFVDALYSGNYITMTLGLLMEAVHCTDLYRLLAVVLPIEIFYLLVSGSVTFGCDY